MNKANLVKYLNNIKGKKGFIEVNERIIHSNYDIFPANWVPAVITKGLEDNFYCDEIKEDDRGCIFFKCEWSDIFKDIDAEKINKHWRFAIDPEEVKNKLQTTLTISEAVKLDCVASHYKNRKSATRGLQRKLERGHSFKHGIDCRKADGEIWLVTRESLEREYKDGKNEI